MRILYPGKTCKADPLYCTTRTHDRLSCGIGWMMRGIKPKESSYWARFRKLKVRISSGCIYVTGSCQRTKCLQKSGYISLPVEQCWWGPSQTSSRWEPELHEGSVPYRNQVIFLYLWSSVGETPVKPQADENHNCMRNKCFWKGYFFVPVKLRWRDSSQSWARWGPQMYKENIPSRKSGYSSVPVEQCWWAPSQAWAR